VLDTWFSSALWPFSTLGWPDKTEDLDYFYPTDVLVTGYDIIFFWVARMIFSGCEHTKQPPFHTVLIHGLVRDNQGRKMSKSLGNGIDPLEMVDEYGADALRFNLVTGNSPGNDMRFYTERCGAMRNFANKIWNASRFVMMNLTITENKLPEQLEMEDKWILSKLNGVIRAVTDNLEKYELGVAAQNIYDFVWDDFCDWYIELTKTRLNGEDPAQNQSAQQVLCYVLTDMLKLLHPFMPFLTEEIYQALPHNEPYLISAQWPVYQEALSFPQDEAAIEKVMEAIKAVRARRAEMNVPPSKKAHVTIVASDPSVYQAGEKFLMRLASASALTFAQEVPADLTGMVSCVTADAKLFLPLAELVDLEKEKARIEKELDKARKNLESTRKKLSNPNFVGKAPEAVIAGVRETEAKAVALVAQLEESLANL
jgi:valyl-tRNA synthetase